MDVREKLIKLIENGVSCPGGRDPFGDYCDTCQYSKSVDCSSERLVDYLISHGVTVQEWISVEERLPEYSNDGFADAVLVTDGFVRHMAYFVGGEWRFAESGEIKEPMWYRITHWMPLPELPKENDYG